MKSTLGRNRTARACMVLAMLGWANAGAAQDAPELEEPAELEPAEPEAEPEPEPAEPEPEPPAPVEEPATTGFSAEGQIGFDAVAEPEPAAGASTGDEIVVTGSRIRRSSFSQPSSVALIDRKQLTRSGATNMADVVRNLTINAGSQYNTDVSTAAAGTAQFNLRGLGLSSTLVLLNGRRVVNSGALSTDGSNFVDINTIPVTAIERIEILKGGASAIYGSDAVAGVVNIITRKNVEGFEVQLGGQATDKFDHGEWDVALTGGTSSDTTRITGTLSYFKREPLWAKDRDFTENGRNVSLLGWPSSYITFDPGTGLPTGVQRDPNCTMVERAGEVTDPNGRPFCTLDFNDYFMLFPDEERVNLMVSFEHDIGDHVTAYVEGAYARARTERGLSPSFPLLQQVIVPADHQYNPYGVPARWLGRPLGGDSAGQTQFYKSDTLHTATGLKGDFEGLSDGKFGDWEWHLGGTWSTNRFYFGLPDARQDQLQGALNSCSPGSDPANCWNPFFNGPRNSAALIDRVIGELTSEAEVQLSTLGFDFNGPLFELPGGDLSLAVGGQLRHESTKVNNDADANAANYNFLIGGPDWQAKRDILAAYGELSLPLVKGLEVQAAGRLEHYDDVGSTLDPMLGLSWTPALTFVGDEASLVSRVRVRGTYATSFRAPSLLQVHGAQTELAPIRNVVATPDGEPSVAPADTYLAVRTRGNPGLDPQQATAMTAGFEWTPVQGLFLQGDYWNYDYKDIIVKENAQQKVSEDYLDMNDPDVQRDPTGLPELIFVDFINAPSVTTHGVDATIMYSSDFNANAGTWSFGAMGSYVLAYRIPQSAVSSTVVDEDFVDCSDDKCDVAGVRNATNFAAPLPRLRMNVPLGWTMNGHTAALSVNFISAYRDDFDSDPAPPMGDEQNEQYNDIDAWATFDLQYSYRIDEGDGLATTIRVGCTNLFDAQPPRVDAPFGYDVLTHDARGRLLYARLIQEF
jgi:iron complex outermembrane recepter protein